MKIKLIIIFLLLPAIMYSGCTRKQNIITGTWKAVSDRDGEDIFFVFGDNNELNVNNQVYTKYFITKENQIIWGQEEPAPFSIEGDMLFIHQHGLTLKFTRVKQPKKILQTK